MYEDLAFRIVFLVLTISSKYIRWHARKLTGWKASWPAMKKNPLDTIILITLSIAWPVCTVIFVCFPQVVSSFAAPIPDWLRWCAVALVVVSLGLILWSDLSLGKNLSVTLKIRDGHTLVRNGPYRWIRHPIYAAGIIYATGLATITANYLLGSIFILPYIMLISLRIGREEQMMIEQFGDEYREFMQQTGRLLPKFKRNDA